MPQYYDKFGNQPAGLSISPYLSPRERLQQRLANAPLEFQLEYAKALSDAKYRKKAFEALQRDKADSLSWEKEKFGRGLTSGETQAQLGREHESTMFDKKSALEKFLRGEDARFKMDMLEKQQGFERGMKENEYDFLGKQSAYDRLFKRGQADDANRLQRELQENDIRFRGGEADKGRTFEAGQNELNRKFEMEKMNKSPFADSLRAGLADAVVNGRVDVNTIADMLFNNQGSRTANRAGMNAGASIPGSASGGMIPKGLPVGGNVPPSNVPRIPTQPDMSTALLDTEKKSIGEILARLSETGDLNLDDARTLLAMSGTKFGQKNDSIKQQAIAEMFKNANINNAVKKYQTWSAEQQNINSLPTLAKVLGNIGIVASPWAWGDEPDTASRGNQEELNNILSLMEVLMSKQNPNSKTVGKLLFGR